MKAEHTKGPWAGIEDGKYRETPWILDHEDDHGATWLPITNSAGRTIALVVNDDTQRPLKMHERETEANARLIAAAPELLEALEDLVVAQNGPPLIREKNLWQRAMNKAEAAIRKAREESHAPVATCCETDSPTPAEGQAGELRETLKRAYWDFDARRKGYAPYGVPYGSEESAFIVAVQAALAAQQQQQEQQQEGRGDEL